jgi:hypothetical protein
MRGAISLLPIRLHGIPLNSNWGQLYLYAVHYGFAENASLKKGTNKELSLPRRQKSRARGSRGDLGLRLIYVGPQHGICFMSPFWHIKF